MLLIILNILIIGNYYIGLIYLMIYIGSIAILFIYILMVLSLISSYRYGYILFILLILLSIENILFGFNSIISNSFNIINLSINLYSFLLIPIALILFIAMIFSIRSI
jgi:hypothetical protein